MGSRDPPARKQAGGGRHPLDSTELLVEFLVEFGLRRYTVPSETRDSLLLKFVNTELKAADHAVITPIQLIVAMGRAQICRPSLAVVRYPPETADYLLRSAERSELLAENVAAGLGGVEYEPVGHYLKTQHLTCQLCTDVTLPEPVPKGKIAAVYCARPLIH